MANGGGYGQGAEIPFLNRLQQMLGPLVGGVKPRGNLPADVGTLADVPTITPSSVAGIVSALDKRFAGPRAAPDETLGPIGEEEAGFFSPGLVGQPGPPQLPGGGPRVLTRELAPQPKVEVGAAPTPLSAPDFSGAVTALGEKPEPIEGPNRFENLAQVLGGAAGGAARNLDPRRGGGSIGAVLAGAGAGAGRAGSKIRDREDRRQAEWRSRVQDFNKTMASIEAQEAKATTDNERFDASLKANYAQRQFEASKIDARLNASTGMMQNGFLVMQQTDPSTGARTVTVEDANLPYKQALLQVKAINAASSGPDKIEFMGEFVDVSVVKNLGPEMWELVTFANKIIGDDSIFEDDWAQFIDPAIQKVTGGEFDELQEFASTAILNGLDDKVYRANLLRATIMALQLKYGNGGGAVPPQPSLGAGAGPAPRPDRL